MIHEESVIQRACVKWFRLSHRRLSNLLFSVPNGAKMSITQAKVMKAEGLLSGVSDLILLYPSSKHHGLCVEMKIVKGRQSDSQREFQRAVENAGYKYIICRSIDDFINEIGNYLSE